jgi:hypothetical protein
MDLFLADLFYGTIVTACALRFQQALIRRLRTKNR